MPFLLYLPACYAEQPAQRYPTIYLLHGLNYSEDQWADLGIVDVADALIASGDLPPIIMVMPRWENRRQAESAIVDFLMPQVEEEQRTRAERSMRAIGGISRGAGWAFRIGFKHGDLFSAIGLHSPAVDLIDVFAIRDWLRSVPEGEAPPRLWIDIGESDTLLASTLAILRALDKYGQPYVWSSSPGGHNAEYWSAHLEEYLLWYAEPWQAAGPVATQQPTP
jgi:enterochelin esterase-like enzyme